MIVKTSKGKTAKYSGFLITSEGIDGSGKTTNMTLLQEALEFAGYSTMWTDWGTSELCGEALTKGRDKKILTPMSSALLQAANIADRLDAQILPHLQKGGIVLADRYVYTIYARNAVRGVDRKYMRDLLSFAPDADLAFYFKLPIKAAIDRKKALSGGGTLDITYYEAGMDMKLADNRIDGFRLFQGKVAKEYEDVIVPEFGFTTIDADRDVDAVQKDFQKTVLDFIGKPVKLAPEEQPKQALGGNY